MRLQLLALLGSLTITACVTDRTPAKGQEGRDGGVEYLCFSEASAEKVAARANAAARRGWQMVASAGSEAPIWCFKRIPD